MQLLSGKGLCSTIGCPRPTPRVGVDRTSKSSEWATENQLEKLFLHEEASGNDMATDGLAI